MLGSLYTGMSGLMAYSQGLDVISTNVANLNTAGYKTNEIQFQDLFYKQSLTGGYDNNYTGKQIGSGVSAEDTSIRFIQGDVKQTGNSTDVAIQGNGFFTLREDGETFYTRNGQFEVGDDGYLIVKNGSARVAGLDSGGNLFDININDLRSIPPNPTTQVEFYDYLSSGASRHVVNDLEIYDSIGEKHLFKVTLVNNQTVTPGSWIIEVEDENGDIVTTGGEVRFQGNGSPESGFNTYTFSYLATGAEPQEITFDFGAEGSFSGVTLITGGTTSQLKVESQNGFGFGALIDYEFDREGVLQASYSNGEVNDGPVLALTSFNDVLSLIQLGNNMYVPNLNQQSLVSTAALNGMGEIVGKSIELSNVDLTQQFTDMIVIQRGYQASSQILTVANEMMQQLLDTAGAK